jgi:sterol desaturase/sphingolipid hydroxylase (fatty acid hydroxylase superfamily)
MEAGELTMEQIRNMELPPIIVYAVPFMLFFVLLEFVIGQYKKRKLYEGKDFLASAAIGIGNLLVNAAVKFGLFAIILVFYNLVPWRVPATWWSYVLCFITIDFCRYWGHRWGHTTRVMWATHVTHHSSEQLNFSTAFRLSWTQNIKIIFFIPVAMMAFHPVVFFICHQIAVLYQFWIHTQLIGKLPRIIEFIFVTPSHHRVHHGKNDKYIDKNYGSTFIIWDRIFGTFQPEEEQVQYGITTPVNSYNPITLNFHEWRDLIRDMRRAKSWKTRLNLPFSRPGTYDPGTDSFKEPPMYVYAKPKLRKLRRKMEKQVV